MIRAVSFAILLLAFTVVTSCGRHEPAKVATSKATSSVDKAAQTVPVPKIDTQAMKETTTKQPELVVIFQHSPRKSVGKLVQKGSAVPPGWEGGGGRTLSLELFQRESNISALLSNGKEGDTASAGK